MTISAATADALAILTEALGYPDIDIADSLRGLTSALSAAVPSYLGLSISALDPDLPLTITAIADSAAHDVRASLRWTLDGQTPTTVTLYAGAPGAFVDLAADLAWLTGRPLDDAELDEHLTAPTESDAAGQLRSASDINQAIGILIGLGFTPQLAQRHLDVEAEKNGTDRHTAARAVLAAMRTDTTGDGGRP